MKNVLVLGASKGIGRATVKKLSNNDEYSIVAVARSKELLISLEKECKNKINIETMDLLEKPREKANILLKKYGVFDIVIHCVGTSLTNRDIFGSWEEALNVNALHAIEINSVLIPAMLENNIYGHVCHVSSISAIGLRGNPTYASSKAFLNAYIKTVGRELAPKNIVVNGVMPGAVSFEDSYWDKLIKANDPKVEDFLKHHQAINRFGTPEEIANVINFLVSDEASFTCGSIVSADGGTM